MTCSPTSPAGSTTSPASHVPGERFNRSGDGSSGRPSQARRRALQARIRSLGARPDALIEVLHAAQDLHGHLDQDDLAFVAASLGVPLSAVYGVATFYSHFTLRPHGAHTCVVCTGTACHIAGGDKILRAARELSEPPPGRKQSGGTPTVLSTRCPGTCSLAPMVLIDGAAVGPVTADEIVERLGALAREGR